MNKYIEMKKRHQERIDALPLHFAFNNDQFDRMMKNWGLDPDKDCDKIVSIGYGGYIQKKDAENMHKVFAENAAELKAAIDADKTGKGFVCDMFTNALFANEYGYTGDPEDALTSLGYSIQDVENNKKLLAGFEKAKKLVEKRTAAWC